MNSTTRALAKALLAGCLVLVLAFPALGGMDWTVLTVPGTEGIVATHESLAIDSAGMAHIVFQDLDAHLMKYAYQDATGWHVETIRANAGWEAYSSLAFDASGTLHLAYLEDNTTIRYAVRGAGGWSSTVVSSQAGTSSSPSLAVGADGRIHLVFATTSSKYLTYAVKSSSTWTTYSSPVFGVTDPSLVLGANGAPQVAFERLDSQGQSGLYYAVWGTYGNAWDARQILPGSYVWSGTLALDSAGLPHVAYVKYANYPQADVGLMEYNGTTWDNRIVDSPGYNAKDATLVLDDADQPHLAYHGGMSDGGGLWYADFADGAWEKTKLDPTGQYDSMTMDSHGNLYIAFSKAGPGVGFARTPEPATIALLGLGALVAIRTRRRRAA